jgi:glycosyl transferase family 2
MMFNDLSLITCSYNTPGILELCLKSFVFHHGSGPHKIIIIENSTNNETQQLLDRNNVSYIANPGGTHSPSVDMGFGLVRTRYALLIDTDVIFKKNISEAFDLFRNFQLTLFGEIQGDRGGFLLYPRIAPYCCFIDMDRVRSMKINFHSDERISTTNSSGFSKTCLLITKKKTNNITMWAQFFMRTLKEIT